MSSLTTDDLLHPEILSRETLITILSQRQIKLDNSQRLDKEKLVDLFHRTVTPLAQREPRSNRRGKATAKKLKRLYGKRAFKLDDNKNQTDGKITNRSKDDSSQQGGLLISANVIPSSKPRLKPPPVVRKRGIIKLNSSSALSPPLLVKRATFPKVEDGGEKKMVIKLNPSGSPTSPPSSSRLEGGVAKISLQSPPVVTQSKKISLKRPSTDLSDAKSPSTTETKTASSPVVTSPSSGEESATSPKKKFKKITWP